MSKNTIKTVVLLAAIGGLFMLVGQLLGGTSGLTIGLLLGLGLVGFSYWFSDTVAIKAARAVPVTEAEMPEYYAIVRDLTTRANMPMPKLYVTPDRQPNAFATGRNPNHAAVAVTKGILEICTWDELRGVLAHEISHVGNRDILIGSIAAALAMAITFAARLAMFAAIFGGGNDRNRGPNVFEQLALIILAPVAAALLQMALSRSREYEADRSGARLIGDGEPLARALAKLDSAAKRIPMNVRPEQAQAYIINPLINPLSGKQFQFRNLFMTHPPTEDRIARLRSKEWAR
jgi:heat shock protein HtpX